MLRKLTTAIVLLLALAFAACAPPAQQTAQATPTAKPTPALGSPTAPVGGSHLAPATALVSNCLGWPEREISQSNFIRFKTSLAEGEPAVDFALKDVNGATYTLSGLLATKPVLLVLGGVT